MTTRSTPWPQGTPSWVNLQSANIPQAQQFYGAVLGWQFQEPDAEYGGYVVAQRKGQTAAGIAPPMQPMAATWGMFFAVDDCDKTAAAITECGGQVLMQPDDVGPLGRMALAVDPTGATFGIWQAGTHIGVGIVNEPGGLSWEDLRSHDPGKAREFYGALFGYRNDSVEGAGADYTTFANPAADGPMGGIGGMFGADDQPSHWLLYFAVDDADRAVAAARDNGGKADGPTVDTSWGRMANLAGPEGERFSIIQLVT